MDADLPKPRTPAITDPGALRAIVSPVRLALYEVLVAGGPATAAQLARTVPKAPGSLSYHLRQLARHGYVEQAPDPSADGRERVWRAVPGGMRWAVSDFARAGASSALAGAVEVLTARRLERLREWNDTGQRWGAAWQEAAISDDHLLRLTPAETAELGRRLREVVEETIAVRAEQGPGGDDDERATVLVFTQGFPVGLPPGADGDTSAMP